MKSVGIYPNSRNRAYAPIRQVTPARSHQKLRVTGIANINSEKYTQTNTKASPQIHEQSLTPKVAEFQLQDKLGKGSEAQVYMYVDENGKQVAVKVFTSASCNNQFNMEVTALKRMNMLVQYDQYQCRYLVMKVVSGESFARLIMERMTAQMLQPMGTHQSMQQLLDQLNIINEQCIDALEQFHLKTGMTHQDVHPGNFMVTSDGQCSVIDFGSVAFKERGTPPQNDIINAKTNYKEFVERTNKLLAKKLREIGR